MLVASDHTARLHSLNPRRYHIFTSPIYKNTIAVTIKGEYVCTVKQGSHRLENYLNIQVCLEKYLKNTRRSWKVLEFLPFTGGFNTVF